MNAAREMPRYQSHKKVWALKIETLDIGENGVAKIMPADEGYALFETRPGWADRFEGSDDDFGYYVRYEDGFTSWSPTEAFENGYTSIDGDPQGV